MSSISPAWKNPRELLRRHQLKRKSNRRLLDDRSILQDANYSTVNANNSDRNCIEGGRNPFKISPRKHRKRIDSDRKENLLDPWEADDNNANSAFDNSRKPRAKGFDLATLYPQLDFSILSKSPTDTYEEKKTTTMRAPVDYRLATSFRIMLKNRLNIVCEQGSTQLLPNRSNLEQCVRNFLEGSNEKCEDFATAINSSAFYWQYPDLPWLSSFPRIERHSRLIASQETNVPSLVDFGQHFIASFQKQWAESAQHLFDCWFDGTIESFYTCCPAFTILFVKIADDEAQSKRRVIVTPTFLGLRQKFRDCGIEYEMPLRSNSRRSSRDNATADISQMSLMVGDSSQISLTSADVTQSQPPPIGHRLQSPKNMMQNNGYESSPDKLNTSDESDHADWMDEIGISPSHVKLRKLSSVSETGNTYNSEELSRSGAIISDEKSIQSLFEFVLHSPICRTMVGPHAGLPPTLLSDRPFLSATLKSLKLFYHESKNDACWIECKDCAVLPTTVDRLFSALQRNCDQFSINLRNRDSCPSLNSLLLNCNSSNKIIDFTDLNYSNGEFSW